MSKIVLKPTTERLRLVSFVNQGIIGSGILPPVSGVDGNAIIELAGASAYRPIDDGYVVGGYHVVADISARDAIPLVKRKEGMRARVVSTDETYELVGGTTNDKWTLVREIDEWIRTVFTATAGQTSFTLPSTATDPDTYNLTVNGIEYSRGTDYIVSGTTLTWLDTFVLAAGDRVIVVYQL